jgi:endonuclease YncB( thermonuclease family)
MLKSSLLALLLCASIAHAEIIAGRVVSVADGDTITLLDASKRHMSDLAFGKVAKADCYKVDQYKRQICTVYVDGQDVGLAQLDAGMAWVYRQYVGELHPTMQIDYIAAEDRARANMAGLWRDREPVPPWEWRRSN